MSEFKYRAFISYSHADSSWARWVHRRLESYRIPRRLRSDAKLPPRLQPIFRDRDELPSAPDLSEKIRTALEQSENLIVICSPAAASSTWVNQEVVEFKRLGHSNRVYCLIVDGDPSQAARAGDCFPPALREHFDADGNPTGERAEPVAADVREHADGKKRALQKVLAGLLGVGLDDLRQRDAQQRHQRMALVTSASLVISIVTVGLAISATLARSEAEQRREQAEDLLGFMVGDLRKSLQPIGRLDLLEGIGHQASEYFATVSVESLTDRELTRQAEVMTQLGEIQLDRLNYDDATASFSEAYERSAALYRNDPADGQRLFNRGQAEFWIGYVASQKGNLDDAATWLTRYRDTTLELREMDPERTEWLREVAYGHHNLAVVNFERGNADAAADGFTHEIGIYDELLKRDPASEVSRDRPDAYSWLGNIALMRGDIGAAVEYFQSSERDFRRAYESDADNAIALDDLAFAVMRVAEVTAMHGDLKRALAAAEEATAKFEVLVRKDETNLTWMRGGIEADLDRAGILIAIGRLSEADALARSAVARLDELVADGAEDHRVRHLFAQADRSIAWISTAAGDFPRALAAIRQGLQKLESIAEVTELNDDRLGAMASLLVLQGEVYTAVGDHDGAASAWQRAFDALKAPVAASRSPHLLEPWSRVLALTGRTDEGNAVSSTLAASGYHSLFPPPR